MKLVLAPDAPFGEKLLLVWSNDAERESVVIAESIGSFEASEMLRAGVVTREAPAVPAPIPMRPVLPFTTGHFGGHPRRPIYKRTKTR